MTDFSLAQVATEKIGDILTTLRLSRYLAIGDVKKAYSQVKLGPKCKKYMKIVHIIFSDGGAYGAVVRVFVGSKIQNKLTGELSAALLRSKHKLPDDSSSGSAPKLEVSGLLLASRMAR